MNNCPVCKPVVFKHDDGWDIYPQADCEKINGSWIPRFFDNPIVEDAKTKKEAFIEFNKCHAIGICLVIV